MQNTIMFIIMVCATFLDRVNPVSTSANPACMKNTRNPVMNVHMMFVAVARSPDGRTIRLRRGNAVHDEDEEHHDSRYDQFSKTGPSHKYLLYPISLVRLSGG